MGNIEKIYVLVDYHTLEKGRYPRELDLSFAAYAKDAFNNFTLHDVRASHSIPSRSISVCLILIMSAATVTSCLHRDASTGFEVAQRFDRNFRLDAADELKELKAFLQQHKIAAVFYTSPLPMEIVQAFGADFISRYTRTLADALGRLLSADLCARDFRQRT